MRKVPPLKVLEEPSTAFSSNSSPCFTILKSLSPNPAFKDVAVPVASCDVHQVPQAVRVTLKDSVFTTFAV
jgi:hypothetical protein